MSDTISQPSAERALIGCVLTMPAPAALRLLEQLEPDDLTIPALRSIATAATTLAHEGIAPDPVVVLGELRRTGADSSFTFDQAAGTYLAGLLSAAAHLGSHGHYLRIVHEHAWRRRVQEAGIRLQQFAGMSGLDDLEQHVAAEVQAIGQQSLRWRQQHGPQLVTSEAVA